MSHRILQFEAERRAARKERDKAEDEVRALRTATALEVQKAALKLVDDLRNQSRERRNRTFDSVETYLQWLTNASSACAGKAQAIGGEAGRLALAHLRLMIANDTVCAINRELTRLEREPYRVEQI